MFLDEANDYYVKPVKDDPPDVEVLAIERDSRAFSTMKFGDCAGREVLGERVRSDRHEARKEIPDYPRI